MICYDQHYSDSADDLSKKKSVNTAIIFYSVLLHFAFRNHTNETIWPDLFYDFKTKKKLQKILFLFTVCSIQADTGLNTPSFFHHNVYPIVQ